VKDKRFFLFSFDFMSIAKRKNAEGLVRAFRRAFPDGEGPTLVVKSINGDKQDFDRFLLEQEIGASRNIVNIDRYMSRVEVSTLTSLADCYVSLHRSEGLGLTIAEAIAHGVPTIATAYSGNLDFMDEWNTWRVPCTMTRVGHGAGGYHPDAQWAEPDLDAAAWMMREVWENPAAARAKASRARALLLESFSVERCGARMKARLEEIWAELGTR
jgi:glycosyltransferase involved in cell wall biosynthesis